MLNKRFQLQKFRCSYWETPKIREIESKEHEKEYSPRFDSHVRFIRVLKKQMLNWLKLAK